MTQAIPVRTFVEHEDDGESGKERAMSKRVLFGVALALAAIAIAGAIGTMAYQAGVAHGVAMAGKLPPEAGWPYAYGYVRPFWHHGPFGFFGIVFPLLFLLLLLGLLRRALWGPWWGAGCGYPGGRWSGSAPPMFEEWHRRAHEPPPVEPPRTT